MLRLFVTPQRLGGTRTPAERRKWLQCSVSGHGPDVQASSHGPLGSAHRHLNSAHLFLPLTPALRTLLAALLTVALPAWAAPLRLSLEPLGTSPESVAISAAPAPATVEAQRFYVGPGDQLTLTVYGQPEMGAEVTVNDNGQITLPLVGMLQVTGHTPAMIEQAVARRLREGDYLRNPEVAVQVKQLKSQMISLLGEVQRPGRYPIQGRLTVLEALASAGGTTPKADAMALVLRRESPLNTDINTNTHASTTRREIPVRLNAQATASGASPDLELLGDDVVYVGPQKLFYVHGQVARPGAYPVEPDLNVMRVLAISGGVSERGSANRVVLHRRNAAGELEQLDTTPDSLIQPGDVVFVKERLF